MISGYTKNLSVQILIALLEKHGIKRAIVSPGTTNLEFVAGLQYNGNFEIFSCIDERSAAYMACGMATESGMPVIISCTEATASREYFPGLTEAFYRKLPIIAVTGVHEYSRIGQLQPQVIDRSISPNDLVVYKAQLPIIKDEHDKKVTEFEINKAILALKRNGGGPVHIDLPATIGGEYAFDTKTLPQVNVVKRYTYTDKLPDLPLGKTVVFIGAHKLFDIETINAIDEFCSSNDSVVFCDHTSGFNGKYAVHTGLLAAQMAQNPIFSDIQTIVHLGEPTGDAPTMTRLRKSKTVWRVSPDGELRNTFGNISAVFDMDERYFFESYIKEHNYKDNFLNQCLNAVSNTVIPIDKLPFSNIYIASQIAPNLPENSFITLGVSCTIRAWTYFEFPRTVRSFSNVGCRGIDGILSSFIGASLTDKNTIHFCILGDLTFFYDMNALGNRHIGNNVRILIINNNGGEVMRLQGTPGFKHIGNDESNKYIAAAGHFGNMYSNVVKSYVESLGFEYFEAHSKDEFQSKYKRFICADKFDKPIVFEVFTTEDDDRIAFNITTSIDVSSESLAKDFARKLLGDKRVSQIKNAIKK